MSLYSPLSGSLPQSYQDRALAGLGHLEWVGPRRRDIVNISSAYGLEVKYYGAYACASDPKERARELAERVKKGDKSLILDAASLAELRQQDPSITAAHIAKYIDAVGRGIAADMQAGLIPADKKEATLDLLRGLRRVDGEAQENKREEQALLASFNGSQAGRNMYSPRVLQPI